MKPPLRIAIAGLGTVGSAVVNLLNSHQLIHHQRAQRTLEVVAVSARSPKPHLPLSQAIWFDNPVTMAAEAEADVLLELIGGYNGVAQSVCEQALQHGKHVITANKALLAHRGGQLTQLALKHQRTLAFEAAVGGGIPIIKALCEGLSANHTRQVYGILNGTCNYILSTMREHRQDFTTTLTQAQKLGYAEAEPSLDIDGIDTAHKLAILVAVAFDEPLRFPFSPIEGIRHLTHEDITLTQELGYRIKLLGIATRHEDGTIEPRVHPCLVSRQTPIAEVEGVNNAIVVIGDFIEQVTLIGPGAGAKPTASAIVADLIDLARGRLNLPLLAQTSRSGTIEPIERPRAYYLRLLVRDQVGVLAAIAEALSVQQISIEQFIQHRHSPDELVSVVLTTYETTEEAMQQGIAAIGQLEAVHDHCMIRIEHL